MKTNICKVCGHLLFNRPICPICNNPKGSVFCYKCGSIINEHDNYCPVCGDDRREHPYSRYERGAKRNPYGPLGIAPEGAEAINLGLPSGIRWASCNVGSIRPEEYGGLYGWGETEARTTPGWNTYTRCGGDENTCFDLGRNIAGTQFDVARAKWGGKWQIPSYEQIKELRDNCSFEWTTLYGVEGGRLTGTNGNSIFLPRLPQQKGNNYWLSEPEGTSGARSFSINMDGVFSYWELTYSRCSLMHIRPVVFL